MRAYDNVKQQRPQEWPGLLERRRNNTMRQRFARAERVLRANPAESLQAACMHGIGRLQVIFPDTPRTALANVIEAVHQARKRRPRPVPRVPTVQRSPRPPVRGN